MLGNKVRELRKSRQLTLAELAANLGISESYLSQLESERVDPSISLVRKLAAEFQVPIAAFFEMEYEKPIVTRMNERTVSSLEDGKVILSRVSPMAEEAILDIKEFTLLPGAKFEHSSDLYYACLFITEGCLIVSYNDTKANLSDGDSIFLPSNICAKIHNESDEICKGILSTRRENGGIE